MSLWRVPKVIDSHGLQLVVLLLVKKFVLLKAGAVNEGRRTGIFHEESAVVRAGAGVSH